MLESMSTRSSEHPRKQPVQLRSKALVGALMKAAARILSHRSIDSVTTNEIADLARLRRAPITTVAATGARVPAPFPDAGLVCMQLKESD